MSSVPVPSPLVPSGFIMVRAGDTDEARERPFKEASIYLHSSGKRIKPAQDEKHR